MDVRPIAGVLGAEIYGVNLKDLEDTPMWIELRQAFLEYHVSALKCRPEDAASRRASPK